MITTLDLPATTTCSAPYLADPDFALEETGARAQVEAWYPRMVAIDSAANKEAARLAVCRATGEKEGNVRKLYYEYWRKSGRDWRALIDRRLYPDPRQATLPSLFKQYVLHIYDGLQRGQTGAEVRRLILEQLARWERDPHNADLALPGYDEPPRRHPIHHYPDGWSERSFERMLPDKYQRALRKQGPKGASEFLPSLYTTREHLAVGQIIYFDDQWHDTYVNLTGVNARSLRPQSFNAVDGLTGYAFEPGLKPQVWDEEKSKRIELNSDDCFWYVISVLAGHGYNATTGTTLVMEHGATNVDKRDKFRNGMKLPDHFNWRLEEITGGKVKIDVSGIWREPAFKGMLFEGKPTGNFRFKAPIESYFARVRTGTCALPGATGLSPDRAPEESHGLLHYNQQLLGLIDKLPRDRFLKLQRPILEWEDYCRVYRDIHRVINRARDHYLQGWEKLGFTGQRYRLGHEAPWIGEEQWQLIPAEHRAMYQHIITQPGNFESFRLSREEAFLDRKDQLTRLPLHAVPLLAPPRMWKEITASQQLELTIFDRAIDSEPLRYFATVRTPQGHEVHLQRGKTYVRLLNIFNPDQLWIAEKDGCRLIGTARRILPPCKTDAAALQSAIGEHAHLQSIEKKEVAVRSESEAAKRVAMREHNRRVKDDDTDEDRARRHADRVRQRAETGTVSDLMPEPDGSETARAPEIEHASLADFAPFTPAEESPGSLADLL